MGLKTQCGKIRMFFNLDFYVKSKCPQILFVNLNLVTFCHFSGLKFYKFNIQNLWKSSIFFAALNLQ